jgi:hypothetical protein
MHMIVERANALDLIAGTEDDNDDCCEQLNRPMLTSGSMVVILAEIGTV